MMLPLVYNYGRQFLFIQFLMLFSPILLHYFGCPANSSMQVSEPVHDIPHRGTLRWMMMAVSLLAPGVIDFSNNMKMVGDTMSLFSREDQLLSLSRENKDQIRKTMLQHEELFKEQVWNHFPALHTEFHGCEYEFSFPLTVYFAFCWWLFLKKCVISWRELSLILLSRHLLFISVEILFIFLMKMFESWCLFL